MLVYRLFSTSRRVCSSASMIDQIISDIANDSLKKRIPKVQRKPVFAVSNRSQIPQYKKRRPQQQQQQQVKFNSGSERLQQAFLMVYKQVKEINPRGRIMEITSGGLQQTNILTLLNTLNLDDEGVELVKVDQTQNESLPLLKRIDLKKAGEIYSDYLHKQMTESTGLSLKRKIDLSKDNTLKQYKLNWNLSLNDLSNVKLKEIWNQILKNLKIEIYIGDKRDLRNIGINFLQQKNEEVVLDNIEQIKREKIVDTILQFIESKDNKVELTKQGNLQKTLITLKLDQRQNATTNDNTNDDEKKKLKELKRQERREREKLKLMRKKLD